MMGEFRPLSLICVYLRETENDFIFLGVCDWYPLLPNPGSVVSVTNAILWGKAILCDQASHVWVPLPLIIRPWTSCEPSRQTRFLLPLPASLKVPGHQADYSLPYRPWRSQASGQLGGVDDPITEQVSITAHRVLSIKSSCYKF